MSEKIKHVEVTHCSATADQSLHKNFIWEHIQFLLLLTLLESKWKRRV